MMFVFDVGEIELSDDGRFSATIVTRIVRTMMEVSYDFGEFGVIFGDVK